MESARQKLLDGAVRMGRHLPAPMRRFLSSWRPPVAEPELEVPPLRELSSQTQTEMLTVPEPAAGTAYLSVWPQRPPPGYLGQLEPDFQERLAKMWEAVSLSDCYFYHRVRLPDGRVVDGVWNLLEGEQDYLGAVPLSGRRVLEVGPASGWLTTWMEGQGAEVVGFDLGWDLAPDELPLPGLDVAVRRQVDVEFLCRVQNAWWYLRREYGLKARIVYGPIYDIPADIGRFDVAVLGAILLHVRDPFLALEQVASRTDEEIVIVEPLVSRDAVEASRPVARWNPSGTVNPNAWWTFSPGLFTDMLSMLGFPHTTVTFHQQPYRPPDANPEGGHVGSAMFTVVGRRH